MVVTGPTIDLVGTAGCLAKRDLAERKDPTVLYSSQDLRCQFTPVRLLMAADKREKSQLHKVALRGSSKQVAEFVRLPWAS